MAEPCGFARVWHLVQVPFPRREGRVPCPVHPYPPFCSQVRSAKDPPWEMAEAVGDLG
jgi:hypothetical protein